MGLSAKEGNWCLSAPKIKLIEAAQRLWRFWLSCLQGLSKSCWPVLALYRRDPEKFISPPETWNYVNVFLKSCEEYHCHIFPFLKTQQLCHRTGCLSSDCCWAGGWFLARRIGWHVNKRVTHLRLSLYVAEMHQNSSKPLKIATLRCDGQ